MFFRKKSEDPWDIDPNKKKAAPAAPQEEVKAAEELPEETTEEAPACPWCGKAMIRGYLRSGNGGVFLWDDEPGWSAALGDMGLPIARDGGMLAGLYAPCWQCKPCRKLVADIPGERRPNYVWKNGKVVLPEEEGETEA
jgi:hypothetical protein